MYGEERICPKCRGVMRRGEIQIPVEHLHPQSISPYTSGTFFGGIPTLEEVSIGKPYWEERTGEKKGGILKRGRRGSPSQASGAWSADTSSSTPKRDD